MVYCCCLGGRRATSGRRGKTDFPAVALVVTKRERVRLSRLAPAAMGSVVFCATGCLNENKNLNKRSIVMRASTSAKSSSGRRSAGKASKTVSKSSSKQKPKWKVVGDKVWLSPGDYDIDDIEAMLTALQGTRESPVPRKNKAVKRTCVQ